MATGYVPSSPLSTLYSNTTAGTVASPDAVDGAVQAIAQTINDNYDFTTALISAGTLSKLNFVTVNDHGVVGDGVADDTTALQEALTAAAGKTLIWTKQAGSNYKTGPLFIPSNVHIIFQPGTLVKARTGFGASDSLLSAVSSDNIVIEGNQATLQMLKSEYTTGEQRHVLYFIGNENVDISDLVLKDSGGDGLIMGGKQTATTKTSKNIRVTNCVVDNMKRNGISVVGLIENVIIDGCTVKNTIGTAPQAAIDIEPNGASFDNKNIIVRNCTIKDNVAGIEVLNNSYDVLIEGNMVYSSGPIKAYRSDITKASPTVEICNNVVSQSTGIAITILECSYCKVHDNTVNSSVGRGIDVEGRNSIPSHSNEIYNNVVNVSGSRGISVSDNYNTRIYGNKVISPTGNGIYVQSITALASHNNYIYNNRVVGATNIGISIEGSIDCVVRENITESCTVRAISIESASHNAIVEDNILISCGVANTTYAISIENSDVVRVRGNKIRKGSNSTLRGINVDSQADDTLIENNDLKDSATTDIVTANASTIIRVNKRNDGSIAPYRAASLPTAQAGYLGAIVLKSAGGVDDEVHVCIINSAAAYAWKKVTVT